MAKLTKKTSPDTFNKVETPAPQIADAVIDEAKIQGGLIDYEKELSNFPGNYIQAEQSVTKMTNAEVTVIVDKLGTLHGIPRSTAINVIGELIRKGGANNNTPPNFKVAVTCPSDNKAVEVQKRDLVRIIDLVCPNKNIKNLSDTLAKGIIEANLKRQAQYPESDFSGDLAKCISVRLAVTGRPPLTPSERVGCASFARYVKDLDVITGSTRISALLAEDLDIRRNNTRNKAKNKNSVKGKKSSSKGFQPKVEDVSQGRKGETSSK